MIQETTHFWFVWGLPENSYLHLLPRIPSTEAFGKPTKVVLRHRPGWVVSLWKIVLGVFRRM